MSLPFSSINLWSVAIGSVHRKPGGCRLTRPERDSLDISIWHELTAHAARVVRFRVVEQRARSGGFRHSPDLGEGAIGRAQRLQPVLRRGVERRCTAAYLLNRPQGVLVAERRHDDGDDQGRDDTQVGDLVLLDRGQEGLEFEALHDPALVTGAEGRGVHQRHRRDVETGQGVQVSHVPRHGADIVDHRVPGRRVVVRLHGRLGQARGARGVQPRDFCVLQRFHVGDAHPVVLALLEQPLPRAEPVRHRLAARVEDEDLVVRDSLRPCRLQDGGQELRLHDEELDLGRSNMVTNFIDLVGRICA